MQCNVTDVTRCGMMMSRLADQSGDTTKSCKAAADIMVCLSPYEEPCSSNKQSMGYGIYNQLVAHVSSLKTLCTQNRKFRKSETEGIQNQDKTGTKANKQKPPPYEKKRTPDMGVRPGAQEE
ncbi:hypothetical protein FSP39_007402 [Pinctada imbricata]|uniref:Uncharacterized protein n=1 Tax=Pinctada imbricata TaxID=66713 RepID=A0AA89BJ72_PINIB|nr:hypothetical protein FSP39_007402 [Pinctada imbricata]